MEPEQTVNITGNPQDGVTWAIKSEDGSATRTPEQMRIKCLILNSSSISPFKTIIKDMVECFWAWLG